MPSQPPKIIICTFIILFRLVQFIVTCTVLKSCCIELKHGGGTSISIIYISILTHATSHHENAKVCQVVTLTVNGSVCFQGKIASTCVPPAILFCIEKYSFYIINMLHLYTQYIYKYTIYSTAHQYCSCTEELACMLINKST